jgi:hypothetical protein
MPPDAANVPGTAFVYEDRLRIVAGRHEAVHRRGKPGDPPASLPEHRAEKLAAVHGARAVLYEKREQLLRLGDDAVALMTALLHHGSHRSNEYVERLYALYEEHGDDALRAAISHAVDNGTLTIAAVRAALRSSSDRARVEPPLDSRRASQPRGTRARKATKRSARAERKGGSR